MQRTVWGAIAVLVLAAGAIAAAAAPQMGGGTQSAAKPDFSITASYIEACSCDMFCPCYFNTHATAHEGKHFCKANLVLKVDKGYYKDTKLDGVKVWVANDLGAHWAEGQGEWLVLTYDSAVTKSQQLAMNDILMQLYPMKWDLLGIDMAPIEWKVDSKAGVATARLGAGTGKGEVVLKRFAGDDPKQEVVVHNLKYWGAQSNTGFRMWKAEHNYYEGHDRKTDTNGTNGFLITITYSGQAKASASD